MIVFVPLLKFDNPCLCFQPTSSQRLARNLGLISLRKPKNWLSKTFGGQHKSTCLGQNAKRYLI